MYRYKTEEAEDKVKVNTEEKMTGEAKGKTERKRKRPLLMELLYDEAGIGVIEVVLILVVLIGLVIIFKNQINALLQNIFQQIESLSESVY